jgi:hypothetical protein
MWNRVVTDRTEQVGPWVDFCYRTIKRGVSVHAYANNHYVGYGPATIQQFREIWKSRALPELNAPAPMPEAQPPQPTLFDL